MIGPLFLLMACGPAPQADEPVSPRGEPVAAIHVRGEVGSVALIGSEQAFPSVLPEDGAVARAEVRDGDLWVEISAHDPGDRVVIRAPAGAEIDVAIGDGDVDLVGLSGRIAVVTATGSVDGDRLDAPVFVARVGRGDVTASFGPDLRAVDVRADDGSVGLLVPEGAWRLELADQDGAGRAQGVWAAPSAGSIVAEAPLGRVYVEGR